MLPFLLLISRWPKRWNKSLAVIAAWMVLMMIVDVYWLVMPTLPVKAAHDAQSLIELIDQVDAGTVSVGWNLSILNFTAVVGMLGLLIAGTFMALRRCSLVPVSDPRLSESLDFENI